MQCSYVNQCHQDTRLTFLLRRFYNLLSRLNASQGESVVVFTRISHGRIPGPQAALLRAANSVARVVGNDSMLRYQLNQREGRGGSGLTMKKDR